MKNFLFLILLLSTMSGCGKKNVFTRDQIPRVTTLFTMKNIIIDHEINLNGNTISLSKQKLIFRGEGKIRNGIIFCLDCTIEAGNVCIAEDVIFSGDWSENEAFPEWYNGSDFTDSRKNFLTLEQLLKAGFKVVLNNMIAITPRSDISGVHAVRNIVIRGKKRETCGLILTTKHKNQFYSYFRSDTGCNLVLENLTLVTEDFLQKKYSEKEADYFFTGSYYQEQFNPGAKPNIDSIIVRNCFFKGNISVAGYGSHSQNQSLQDFIKGNYVKKVIIEDNAFDCTNSPFFFSNMAYGDIIISGNTVKNFSAAFFAVPESGLHDSYYETVREKKGTVIIKDNIFRNEKVMHVPDERTLSPCVIKGGYGSLEFEHNRLENLLSSNPNADVNTFYFTSESPGYVRIQDNIIKNVVGRGSASHPASLIKHRWADRFYMENNTVTLDNESLYKIGVLAHAKGNFSEIKSQPFYMDFFQIGGQTTFRKIFHVMNNTFVLPVLNKSTEIFDIADFRFENNTVTIGYFGPSGIQSSVSRDNTFFLGRQRLDRPESAQPGNFIFSGNTFNIGKTGGDILKFIDFPDGVQIQEKDAADKNFNYKNVIIRDTFFVQETALTMTLPDGENQLYDVIIHGSKNSFYLKDFSNANHLRPNAKSLASHIVIDDVFWTGEMAPFVFVPDSRQVLDAGHHAGNKIHVLNYIYFQSLFNMAAEEDLLIQILLKGEDKRGNEILSENFLNLHQKGRSLLFENADGLYLETDPSVPQQKNMVIQPYSVQKSAGVVVPTLVLEPGNKHLKEARVYFVNCSDIVQYTLECNVIKAGFQKADRSKTEEKINILKRKKVLSE